jgi:hypothetical protein
MDFAAQIPSGDSIASVVAALTVHSGADPSPSSRLSGAPAFSGTIVTQTLAGLQAGAVYNLLFTVTTAGGRILPNFARIGCISVS